MIDAVLLDLDGVIRIYRDDDTRLIELSFGLPPGSIDSAAFTMEFLNQVTTGSMSRQQWVTAVGVAIGCPEAAQAWERRPVSVDHRVVELARAIKSEGVQICLITNGTDNLRTELTTLGLIAIFDAIFNSSELRVAKPSVEIFEIAIRSVGVQPERIAYVDDTEANVAAAKTLGIRSLHYAGAAQLRRWLSELGMRIPDLEGDSPSV